MNTNLKIVHEAIKECLDKPDEEVFNEALDSNFTVRDAKNALKYHDLLRQINHKLQGMDMSSINKLQYRNLVQVFTKRIIDSSINDIFNFLTKKSESKNASATRNDENKSPRNQSAAQADGRLEVSTLQAKFETFCKNQESLSSILNVKLIRQRFADFQTKLKVWK